MWSPAAASVNPTCKCGAGRTSACRSASHSFAAAPWHFFRPSADRPRAMPVAAAVVGDCRVRAVLAACDVAAERRRAATLDRRHDLELAEADMTGVGHAPGGPVVAEDVRDLQSGTGHER